MSKRSTRRKISAKSMKGTQLIFAGGETTITAEAEKTATFSMTLYSGGPIKPEGWRKPHPLVVDLDGMVVIRNGSIPFNRGHRGDEALVGQGTAKITAGEIKITDGVFSFSNEHTEEIIESSKSGFVWASSMEATLLSTPRFIAAGKTVRVNDRNIAGPVYVAADTELFAGAFIGSNPADRTTAVSIAAQLEQNMNPELKAWLESRDIECEGLNDEQIKAWQTDYDVIHATAAEVVEAEANAVATVTATAGDDYVGKLRTDAAAEHARIDVIAKHCGSGYQEIKAKAISEGWGEDKVELAVVKAKQKELEDDRASRSTGPAIHGTSSEDMLDANVYGAALHQAMDTDLKDSDFLAKSYGEKECELAKKVPKNAGLQYLCFSTIRAAGGNVEPGMGLSGDLWSQTIKADRTLRAAGSGFSTFSLTDTLSNIAHKMLMKQYEMYPSLVARICSSASHTDFKEHTKVAVDGDLELLQLPPTGEIKHGTLSDVKYTNIVYTWARLLSITRPDFFNDDLGAFERVGNMLGRGAVKAREKLMWLTILEPAKVGTFWLDAAGAASAGGNAVTNHITTTALDNPGLAAAQLLIKQMNDTQGDPIMITPDAVVTGTALSKTAEDLLNFTTVQIADNNESAGTPSAELRIQDQFKGKFGHIESPWIDARLSIPGSSDGLWFLLGDRNDAAAFEYATLRGAETPNIDSADTEFNTLGFQSRAYWDYGFNEQDPRGMIRLDV